MTPRLRLSGAEVRHLRHALGLTQQELAKRLRIHRVTVQRWEADALRMRPSHAQALRFYARTKGLTLKRDAANLQAMPMKRRKGDVKTRIDAAINASARQSQRADDAALPVYRPDSDGQSADGPKRTDDTTKPRP